MRLVKRSVNQDDPNTYHLFYADAEGHPGSDLTFFPWTMLAPPRLGHGLAVEVDLEIPRNTIGYWTSRLERYGAQLEGPETRFGDTALRFADPHGLRLALIEPAAAPARVFTPWAGGPVAGEHQIRGLYGAQIWERDAAATVSFLTGVLGFERLATENGWTRFGFEGTAGVLDLRETPDARRGAWGVGAVHHLAWRVDDERQQLAVREQVESAGGRATSVIDRFWFKSVYFKEPGGVLFELATDGPGFAVDEESAHLGETLVLPPFLEHLRKQIEQVLPPLALPSAPEPLTTKIRKTN
jgi:glyoxalase family protein